MTTTAATRRRRPKRSYADLTPRQRHREMLRTLARPFVGSIALMLLYYRLPLDRSLNTGTVAGLAIGLALVGVGIGLQVKSIMSSNFPRLRAIGAIAITVPLFLVLFATGYYKMAHGQPGSFNEPLTRTDSLYFTMTVFSTVGFGDIAPVSQVARVVTMIQMGGDLLLFGILGKVILGAVSVGMEVRSTAASTVATPPEGPAAAASGQADEDPD